ncbi:hypothetical protein BLNAU_4654 [Blattamonas nauphoetae]|uniref:Uncharacterized protein n=1 Tax=Blattamonas nauphoetae TaxID=2049346 RepID=A0ABQ9Y9J2_9EUKA|nr:hypothetical protein BLNAU_4654 [Blattamonas nauphoetae]
MQLSQSDEMSFTRCLRPLLVDCENNTISLANLFQQSSKPDSEESLESQINLNIELITTISMLIQMKDMDDGGSLSMETVKWCFTVLSIFIPQPTIPLTKDAISPFHMNVFDSLLSLFTHLISGCPVAIQPTAETDANFAFFSDITSRILSLDNDTISTMFLDTIAVVLGCLPALPIPPSSFPITRQLVASLVRAPFGDCLSDLHNSACHLFTAITSHLGTNTVADLFDVIGPYLICLSTHIRLIPDTLLKEVGIFTTSLLSLRTTIDEIESIFIPNGVPLLASASAFCIKHKFFERHKNFIFSPVHSHERFFRLRVCATEGLEDILEMFVQVQNIIDEIPTDLPFVEDFARKLGHNPPNFEFLGDD